jgi:hypothetical protein
LINHVQQQEEACEEEQNLVRKIAYLKLREILHGYRCDTTMTQARALLLPRMVVNASANAQVGVIDDPTFTRISGMHYRLQSV